MHLSRVGGSEVKKNLLYLDFREVLIANAAVDSNEWGTVPGRSIIWNQRMKAYG